MKKYWLSLIAILCISNALGVYIAPPQPISKGGTGTTSYIALPSPSPSTSGQVPVSNAAGGYTLSNLQISQAQQLGQVTITGCASPWAESSSALSPFGTQSGCSYATSGLAQAPSSNLPAITFSSLAPGNYYVTYNGQALVAGSGSGSGNFAITDGSSYGNIQTLPRVVGGQGIPGTQVIGSFIYTTPQSNITFSVQAGNGTGSANDSLYIYGTTANPGQILVYYFPTQSQIVLPASNGGLNAADITYTAQSTCPTGTIPADGTSYSTSTYPALYNAIGYTYGGSGSSFNVPDGRGIFLRGAGTNGIISASNGSSYTGTLGSYTQDQMQGHFHSLGSNQSTLQGGAGNITVGAGTSYALGLGYTSNPITDGTNGTPLTGFETRPANLAVLTCIRTVPASPMPVFTGSVTSSGSGQYYIEGATIVVGSSAAITTQSGSWISNISSVAAGVSTVTYTSGEFSAVPWCTLTAYNSGSGNSIMAIVAQSSAGLTIYSQSPTGTNANASANIICMGPH